MEQLISYLETIYPMSEGLRNWLSDNLKRRVLNRKEFILEKGNINVIVCFISKGMLRCHYNIDEQEVSAWFMKEGDIVLSVESFFRQTPSEESIQALEETIIDYITYDELQYLFVNPS